jgi:hypothetical protein
LRVLKSSVDSNCVVLISCCGLLQVLLDSINGTEQQQQQGGSSPSPVLQRLPQWLASTRQDLERALARVGAGTAAPAEAVGLWTKLAQVCVGTKKWSQAF